MLVRWRTAAATICYYVKLYLSANWFLPIQTLHFNFFVTVCCCCVKRTMNHILPLYGDLPNNFLCVGCLSLLLWTHCGTKHSRKVLLIPGDPLWDQMWWQSEKESDMMSPLLLMVCDTCYDGAANEWNCSKIKKKEAHMVGPSLSEYLCAISITSVQISQFVWISETHSQLWFQNFVICTQRQQEWD